MFKLYFHSCVCLSAGVETFTIGQVNWRFKDTGRLAVPQAWGIYHSLSTTPLPAVVKGRNLHIGIQVDSGESQLRFSSLHTRHYPDLLYHPTHFFLDVSIKEVVLILTLKFKKSEEESLANTKCGLNLGPFMPLCNAHIPSVVYSDANFRISPQPSFKVAIM